MTSGTGSLRGSPEPRLTPSIDKRLYIGTYNVRSLVSNGRQDELEHALKNIKWDILGLSEIKKPDMKILEYDEYILMYNGDRAASNGVGFMVRKTLKHHIIDFICISDRVVRLDILLENKNMTCIQTYAPTEKSTEAELQTFYDDLDASLRNSPPNTIVLGDFNAKIGQLSSDDGRVVGKWGYGIRNDRGEILVQYCLQNQLYISNTFFKKKPKQRWTWL